MGIHWNLDVKAEVQYAEMEVPTHGSLADMAIILKA